MAPVSALTGQPSERAAVRDGRYRPLICKSLLGKVFWMKPLALVYAAAVLLCSFKWYLTFNHPGAVVTTLTVGSRSIVVREARELKLPPVPGSPVGYDCNNALFWDDGTLYCFTSHEHPFRSQGADLNHLESPPTRVQFHNAPGWTMGGRWIEAVYKIPSDRLYMWYHNEPHGVIPARPELTAPRIGQMYSDDNGLHWHDQGIVLEAAPGSFVAETANHFFVGGHGDFTVIADPRLEYFYFLFSTYSRGMDQQGVAIARMAAADLEHPVGKVSKWHEGRWTEPGLGGLVTTIFGAEVDWHKSGARAYWGPSVHWNTYLREYVMLLNKSIDGTFKQGGAYISFNARLDDPSGWTTPVKVLDTTDWYPQVVGADPGAGGTDRLAGRVSRLFVKGRSAWEIEFE
jgi:hypothetical protein